jgi:hypothetical protein
MLARWTWLLIVGLSLQLTAGNTGLKAPEFMIAFQVFKTRFESTKEADQPVLFKISNSNSGSIVIVFPLKIRPSLPLVLFCWMLH